MNALEKQFIKDVENQIDKFFEKKDKVLVLQSVIKEKDKLLAKISSKIKEETLIETHRNKQSLYLLDGEDVAKFGCGNFEDRLKVP